MDGFNAESKDIMQNYILAFAINKYADSRFDRLDKPQSEMEKFVQIVTHFYYGFDTSRIEVVSNEAATKINILEKIKQTASKKPNAAKSNLIIYFSGQGYFDYYLGNIVPQDADLDDVRTFISYKRIIEQLKDSPFHHILIISDACYAGKLFDNKKPFYDDINAYKKPSRCLFTSGLKEEVCNVKKRINNTFSFNLNKILVLNRASAPKSISAIQIQGELKNMLMPETASETPQYKSISPDLAEVKIEGFENKNGVFTFFPKPLLYSENLSPQEANFLEKIRNEAIIKPQKPEKPLKPRLFPVALLILFFVLGINAIQKTADDGYTRNVDTSIPKGLLDSLPPRRIPPDIQKAIDGNPNELPPPQLTVPLSASKPTTTRFVRFDEKGNLVYTDEQNLNINNRIKNTDKMDSTNVVFVGSFHIKENAEYLMSNLKSIGYKEAEIVMKENMPYAVVVSGFYANQKEAKDKVYDLKKQGFDVYLAKEYWREIYRK